MATLLGGGHGCAGCEFDMKTPHELCIQLARGDYERRVDAAEKALMYAPQRRIPQETEVIATINYD